MCFSAIIWNDGLYEYSHLPLPGAGKGVELELGVGFLTTLLGKKPN